MIVIPALDLKDGRCVRLYQGMMDKETVFSKDPVQMAKHWESKGAERLHVVDLNGALLGRAFHKSLIEEISHSISIPIEVGGGIRSLDTIERYLSSGVGWVIIGTEAYRNPKIVEEACRKFPKRVILGVDVREGRVGIEGWKETTSIEAKEFVKRFGEMDLSAVIFTDIERDGTGKGLNLEATRLFASSISIPVIASGGISRIEEIESLIGLKSEGVIGLIVGKALYTGEIDLEEAISLTKREGSGIKINLKYQERKINPERG